MKDKNFTLKLNEESKERKEMLNDAIEAMTNYSGEILKKDADLEQYRIDEIKYKTTIKELNEYIEIYKNRQEVLERTSSEQDEEIMSLRKKVLKDKTDLSALKTILEIFINEYGIEQISAVTKIEKEKLMSYIER